ncbi:MAG: STAS domain-containing protein [Solirubrobacteraceae bacterium]
MRSGDAQAPAPREFDAAAPSVLRIEVVPESARVSVVPTGELDLSNAEQLRDDLDRAVKAGFTCLVLDLRELQFMDSTGLALIIETYQACRQNGCQLSIIQGPRQVRHLFEITGLLDELPFAEP